MGLDMYLTTEKYVDKYQDAERAKKVKDLFPEIPESDNLASIELKFEVGYWRKANQIHTWFVNNIQDGVDDCKSYWVDKDKLKELLKICNKVLEHSELVDGYIKNGDTYKDGKWIPNIENGKSIKDIVTAEDLLPTSSGFFFGGTAYDEWYIKDIEYTKHLIEKILNNDKIGSIYYQSSW